MKECEVEIKSVLEEVEVEVVLVVDKYLDLLFVKEVLIHLGVIFFEVA